MKKIILLFALSCFTYTFKLKAADGFKPVPKWVKEAVFYQIYPQSFKDTNGDGIGDINGITEKLDYLKWLGVNAIWINPCFTSEFKDAGYDVTDFYQVAPRYGNNADLKRLFQEAKKRGMKVCLDLVAGHTSDQHPWFKESAKKTTNAYTDRYIWTNDHAVKPDAKYVTNNYERNGTYRKNFFDVQPALNYGFGNPDPNHPWEQPVTADGPVQTKKELMKIMDFWMDMGCDGFRVDMAHSLIKNDPEFTATNQLWHEIRTRFQGKYPEGIIIAEWGDPAKAVKAGFMMDFIIHLRTSAYSSLFFNKTGTYTRDTCYFSLDGNGTAKTFAQYYEKQLAAIGKDGYTCVPTSNHDFQRPNAGGRNTDEQLKVAMTFFMTLPSVPLIYYGDEIGMKFIPGLPDKEGSMLGKGNRAGSRTPMQWSTGPNAGFSSNETGSLYLPLDPYEFRPNVESQKTDPSSLLNFTRHLLALRKSNQALGMDGAISFWNTDEQTYPLVYQRTFGKERFVIVLNPSAKRQTTFLKTVKKIEKLVPVMVNKVNLNCTAEGLDVKTDGLAYGIFKILD
ncbi:alpha-amylase family glycosyl hydrolase [Pedobacter sp.]